MIEDTRQTVGILAGARIDAWLCRLPLRLPVQLGAMRYVTRDYVVLRVRDGDGFVGRAIGYTRGTPLLESLRMLVDSARNSSALSASELQQELRERFAPGWASFIRAASLLDIALWDIQSQRDKKSMRDFLGESQANPGKMIVAGYFADQRGQAEILDEVAVLIEQGASIVKIMVPGFDHSEDLELVKAVKQLATTHDSSIEIGVDLHGSLIPFTEAAAESVKRLLALGVDFVEDPYAGQDWRPLEDLQHRTGGVQLAVGEDLVSIGNALDLLPLTHLFRLDATVSGGYTFALEAIQAAKDAETLIAPHVFSPIHAPLAGITSLVDRIEFIPPLIGADPVDLLFKNGSFDGPEPLDVASSKGQSTGLALPLDWTKVEMHAEKSWTVMH